MRSKTAVYSDVNVSFQKDFDIEEVREILRQTDGITVEDNLDQFSYPMPRYAKHKDEVFVGRIRRDDSAPNTLNMWVVADNLRKGAATNAVQIAQYLIAKGYIGKEMEIAKM